jgi:hypothetical protein
MCKSRSANGLRGIRLLFKAMDRDGNKSLDPVEFKYAMRDYGLALVLFIFLIKVFYDVFLE